jgi:citrate synthase
MGKESSIDTQDRLALESLSRLAEERNTIPAELYQRYQVKRGLRNEDGSGVLVGLTEIGDVHGFIYDEGVKIPDEGRLTYRGIRINDIVRGFHKDKRFGFEEVCYLLLFGELPDKDQLDQFTALLGTKRELPSGFMENMILKNPSSDVMNHLARCVLVSYSFDPQADDISVTNVLRQSLELIARIPTMAAYGYQSISHHYAGKSLVIHRPRRDMATAQNFLHLIRSDSRFSALEAEILDLSLVLHAEHGGGNNSTFTTHVVTSTSTDTYSVIAAAIGSLKGPIHGGANKKVMGMIEDIKSNVKDWDDAEEIENYLGKIVRKEAFDRSGLIYGLGHPVYTLSDPRAVLLKEKARNLAGEKGMEKEFALYEEVARQSVKALHREKNSEKPVTPNIDFYSGLVYKLLNIPVELYTPLFTMARIVGWTAHRLEELVSGRKIIRPAYRNVFRPREYVSLQKR